MENLDLNVLFLAISNVVFFFYGLFKAIKGKNYKKALEILAYSIEKTSDKSTKKGSAKNIVKETVAKHKKSIRKVIDKAKDKVVEEIKKKKGGKKILKVAKVIKDVIEFIF